MFWLVMFAVVLAAANWLGLSSVAAVIGNLVTYIPSVITAIVIIVVGILLGQFVNGLIGTSIGGLHGGKALARAGQAGVVIIATFMALQELGIASDIVTTAFAILFGAIALALALAFGLGNRDLAGEITRAWYEQYSRERRESAARMAADEDEESGPPEGDATSH
jgi:vacuolar-type H+-ATPase subunit I/STV1